MWRTGLILGFCWACGWLMGCQSVDPPSIRVALSQWPAYELFRLAAFADSSQSTQNLHFVEFLAPLDARRAYELGQVDVLCCTIGEFLQIQDVGDHDPVIVYVIDSSIGGDMLLAPDTLTSLQGLRGLRVGMEPGTVSEILLLAALKDAGLELKDVQHVPLHLQLQRGPLTGSGLDAVVCFPPYSTALLKLGGLKSIYDSSQLSFLLLDVLVVERRLLEQRPEDLRSLVTIHQQAIALQKTRPQWADSLMAGWERVTVADLEASFELLALHDLPAQRRLLNGPVQHSLSVARALSHAQGLLKRSAPGNPVSSQLVQQEENKP